MSNILSLYPDIQYHIISYLFPREKKSDIKIYELILNKCFKENPIYFLQKISSFKKLLKIYDKYTVYPIDEIMYVNIFSKIPDKYYIGGHALYDLLSTGCNLPFSKSSFKTYTKDIEDDIKFMIVNNPQSIHCSFGILRCRERITTLAMACINYNIPIDIIELMLINGADPNAGYYVNGYYTNMMDDLVICMGNIRYSELENLFKKYEKLKTEMIDIIKNNQK